MNLFITFLIAFAIILIALLILGISWVITGKNRLRGSCGMNPNQKRDEACKKDISCPACFTEDKKKDTRPHQGDEK